jgi:hypothetical protein
MLIFSCKKTPEGASVPEHLSGKWRKVSCAECCTETLEISNNSQGKYRKYPTNHQNEDCIEYKKEGDAVYDPVNSYLWIDNLKMTINDIAISDTAYTRFGLDSGFWAMNIQYTDKLGKVNVGTFYRRFDP